jgi:hypothetical protein
MMYWLEDQVAIAFHSSLHPASDRQDIITSLRLERRSRNGKDEIDRPSERWLAQEKRPWEAEKRRCNHPFGNHQSSYQNKKSRL